MRWGSYFAEKVENSYWMISKFQGSVRLQLGILTRTKSIRSFPREKPDDVIMGHFSKRENGNWMENLALLHDRSIWYLAWLGKPGVNVDFRHIWAWFMQKNLRERGLAPLGRPRIIFQGIENIVPSWSPFHETAENGNLNIYKGRCWLWTYTNSEFMMKKYKSISSNKYSRNEDLIFNTQSWETFISV